MASFENFLWWIFIIFTLICGGFCIEAHYRYKNKNGIDNEYKFSNKYKYFGQVDYRMKLATQLVVNKKRHSA